MTLIWLIVLGINGHHWSELHPWTTTFTVLFIAAVLDSSLFAGGNRWRSR